VSQQTEDWARDQVETSTTTDSQEDEVVEAAVLAQLVEVVEEDEGVVEVDEAVVEVPHQVLIHSMPN